MAQQPPWVRATSLLRIRDYITYTPHSVGLLWTSDQPDAETSMWQHTTPTTDIHAPGGIRNHNPNKRAATYPRLRALGNKYY